MPEHPTIPGDDAMATELLTCISRIAITLRSQAWRSARARRLTPTQSQILALIGSHGEPLRLNDVAQALGISSATASDAVSTLVQKGLVTKERNTSDFRSLALCLTEAGADQARLSAQWPDSIVAAMRQLSKEEQAELLKGLVKVLHSLQESGQLAPTRGYEPPRAPGVKQTWEQRTESSSDTAPGA